MLIQIKNWITGHVIFESDKENSTFKDAVEEAVRRGISLREADLRCADLHGADLRNADLSYTVLRHSNLSGANLRGADLSHTVSIGTNLTGADLTGAEIRSCHFSEADFTNTIMPDLPMTCPDTGSFIGYKKILNTKFVKIIFIGFPILLYQFHIIFFLKFELVHSIFSFSLSLIFIVYQKKCNYF